jgi:hypothetical protein
MNDKQLKEKIKIITEKVSDEKTDSIFYDGCDIAEITDDNGTRFIVIASGDIRININDDTYRNNQIDDAETKYKLTDKKLKELEAKGKLTWENNNWFEVIWILKGSKESECEIGDVAYNYDEAIELLLNYARERGKWK